jgi:hypothetical protein
MQRAAPQHSRVCRRSNGRTYEREERGDGGNGILGQREDWASVAVDHRHASFLWQASRRQARRAARWWSDIFLAAKQHIAERDRQVGTRAEADRATSTLRGSSRKMQATFLHYDWLPRRVASCQSGCASPDRAQRRRTERSAATTPTGCSLTLRPAAQSKCPTAQPSTAELLRGRRSTKQRDRPPGLIALLLPMALFHPRSRQSWERALAGRVGPIFRSWPADIYCISECNFAMA